MAQTGPKTFFDKKRAALNSLTHGLNVKGFLPCKKERCFFFDICILQSPDGNPFEGISFGHPCPVEKAKYDLLLKGLATSLAGCINEDKAAALHELIMLRIQQDRQLMLAALEGDLVRDVPRSNHGGLALNLRYRRRLKKRISAILIDLFN